jgi:hypothetical protein
MKTGKGFDITQKARIYHTLAQMTSSFSSIIRYCDDLQQAGVLTPKYRHLFQGFTLEVQSDINREVLQYMDHVEMDDWSRGGKVREEWEKHLRFENERPKKKPHKALKRPGPLPGH